ncbi:uncharacterized protein HKW66_Vig0027280 [Vigna angularis]|uniref:Uncharacterized protein n=2 Tax=Phaseolus angularis TaxID=3914 RepID=A0A8T0L7J3_PHAAN|nr:uncharacterized protein LOC108335956 [Vigna angularis]KAG2407906.1 uncharacterized protein HKW66_Vig0027280 [Vigna angularis]BAT76389.1 hypothetical protein VIGAN_01438100 [Vigna angularis var. angularis]
MSSRASSKILRDLCVVVRISCLRIWVRKGVSKDIGREDMNPRPLVPLIRTAAVIFGGVVTLNLTSTVTIKLLRFASEKKREKVALPCRACRGKGFYICKLCNGNATIAWSPMFDPIAINPCVCPTCEGNRVQRCLNCLGKGYD